MRKVTMRRKVSFKDGNGNIAKIEIEIKDGRFSMRGDYANGCGQCNEHIKPKNEAQKKLLYLWERWHLNDMKAGCIHQRQEGWQDVRIPPEELPNCIGNRDEKGIIATWVKPENHPKGLLTKPCPVCGYKYGTSWLKEELPHDIVEQVNSLCKEIEKIEKKEKEQRNNKSNITWDDIIDCRIIALAQHLGLSPVEAQEDIAEEDENLYSHGGIEYFVGTEDEAEEEARRYLTDDPELWKQAVQDGQTTQSLEEWVDDVINMDGVGHILNHWDGSEDEEEVNGVNYTIIRR